MEIFAQATKQRLRFASEVGDLTVEDLWELPMTSKRSASLDSVSRIVMANLGDRSESLVEPTPSNEADELRRDILKAVIADRKAEADAKANAEARAEKKRKLMDALARKQDAALEGMSEEEIRAALDELAA